MALDGGAVRRVIWITLPRREKRNTGGSTVAHNLKCGGGCSGPHWESLVTEWGEEDSRDDDSNAEQPEGRTIQEMEECQRQAEEGHTRMKAKAAFLMLTTDWWLPPTRDGSSLRLIR